MIGEGHVCDRGDRGDRRKRCRSAERGAAEGPQVKEEGWLPQHVLVRDSDSQELLGAVPLYLKSHSYGE